MLEQACECAWPLRSAGKGTAMRDSFDLSRKRLFVVYWFRPIALSVFRPDGPLRLHSRRVSRMEINLRFPLSYLAAPFSPTVWMQEAYPPLSKQPSLASVTFFVTLQLYDKELCTQGTAEIL